jgi:long-subunit acyl-CoA synthetase (AMP-forming)
MVSRRRVVPGSGHADGEVGELLIRGAGVMIGYNKREPSEVFDVDGW